MSEEAGELVFVHGALRRGGPEAFRMDGAVFLSRGTVPGTLYRLGDGPVLVSGDETSRRVTGDVYRVSPDHLQNLDELEGLNPEKREQSDRRRSQVLVQGAGNQGDTWIAWAWIWNGARDPGKRIRSGDWLQEYRPGVSGKLQVYPWFTMIGMICLGSFLLCLSINDLIGKDDSLLARIVPFGAALSPFAALSALWIASRRGEKDGGLFEFLVALSLIVAVVVAIGVLASVSEAIRK